MKNKWIILFCALLIALLNLIDGIATHYGLANNMIEELNPLMDYLMTISPIFFLCIKIVLSFFIVCTSYLIYKKSNASFQKIYVYCLVGVSFMYFGITGMHIYWLSFL